LPGRLGYGSTVGSELCRGTIAVVGCLLVAGVPTAAGASRGPCAAAAALAKIGRTDDAQAAYLALLKTKPVASCAPAGLRRLARREFSAAGALIHAGYRDEAMKRIESARAASPAAPVPVELRRFVVARRTFDKVRALEGAGLDAVAEDMLRDYLKRRPTPAGGVPADMIALLQEPDRPWLRRAQVWVERQTDSGKALLWLLAIVLGGLLLGRELLLRLWRIRHPRLSITPFLAGSDEKDIATGFGQELQEAVANVGAFMGGRRPDLTLPPKPAASSLPSVTAALPQLKFVEALIALLPTLIPSRDQSLSGFLQPKTNTGVGASIALIRDGGKVIRQVTIRQGDFGPVPSTAESGASDYGVLLPPATYWFRAATSKSGAPWRPHALFDAGVRLQQAGDVAFARRLYSQALSYAPPIPGVLLNLAAIEIKEAADPEQFDIRALERGVARLEQALEYLS
jgi:tetratricopeptide (TPR) repeat protein